MFRKKKKFHGEMFHGGEDSSHGCTLKVLSRIGVKSTLIPRCTLPASAVDVSCRFLLLPMAVVPGASGMSAHQRKYNAATAKNRNEPIFGLVVWREDFQLADVNVLFPTLAITNRITLQNLTERIVMSRRDVGFSWCISRMSRNRMIVKGD
jgi:hypothetical protein